MKKVMKNFNHPNDKQEMITPDIAIIGLSLKFPDADTPEKFWNNIISGKESIRKFSRDEILSDGVEPNNLKQKNFINAGSYIDHIDRFDADFFGYSAEEAKLLDPQLRLSLEKAWEAIENAGYSCQNLRDDVGVYIAVPSVNTYLNENLKFNTTSVDLDAFQKKMYNCGSTFASRIAYHLNLTGPALAIQSGCSSALVGINLAIQSLASGECSMALIGAVSIEIRQKTGYFFDPKAMFSSDGHCRSFDNNASGTVFGNGLGFVVIKKLTDAIRDGDKIESVIKGISINNDGKNRMNFSAPSVTGQIDVITKAINTARISPETISYIEGHGTGTQLGDFVEVTALTKAYQQFTTKNQYCAIGSVKPNIGHLGVAAGIAGLIKTILALKNKVIPASINFSKPNLHINFQDTPFYINTTNQKWQCSTQYPRRAAVSAFGMGGTNAHVILEEYTIKKDLKNNGKQYQLICLSAKTHNALQEMKNNLLKHLQKNHNQNIEDIAYTLQVGRAHFKYRFSVLSKDIIDLLPQLKESNETENSFQQALNVKTENITNNPTIKQVLLLLKNKNILDYSIMLKEKNTVLALKKIWDSGYDINFQKLYSGKKTARLALPTYPFQRRSFWISSNISTESKYRDSVKKNKIIHKDLPNNKNQSIDNNISIILEEKLYAICGETFPKNLQHLDSLSLLLLIDEINKTFKIGVSLEKVCQLESTNQLARHISNLLATKNLESETN